ncbi:DeoR/GlpR family DNA-binding transcription regulator [Sulfitobacter sp.]|jgi:DeoR family glycerol-3-phosphate regulon repressor|uniref:DeoR/GlpR family DNA-binding transcription regulator n=1 Tax=Sulfitobacter sp. TaxID=1903071 RepID=UPI00300202F3
MKKPVKHSHREMELLEALHRLGGSARSAELAKTLDVSEETVRRTIKGLSKSGVVERMYGGAYLVGPRTAPSFFNRITKNAAEKRAIATGVVERVHDGMSLFLDVGSTTAFVAEKLRDRFNLTVATNSIGVAQVLSGHNANRVHLLGGEMQTDERGTFGFVTEQQCRRFSFDMAIFSTDVLSIRSGFLYLNAAEANLAAVVADCSERVLVALDHHKFEQTAPHLGFDASNVDDLVTDQLPKSDLSKEIQGWGINVHLANGDDIAQS